MIAAAKDVFGHVGEALVIIRYRPHRGSYVRIKEERAVAVVSRPSVRCVHRDPPEHLVNARPLCCTYSYLDRLVPLGHTADLKKKLVPAHEESEVLPMRPRQPHDLLQPLPHRGAGEEERHH